MAFDNACHGSRMKAHDYPVVFAAWLFTTPRWSHVPPLAQAIYPTLRTCCDADGFTLFCYAGLAEQAGFTLMNFRMGLDCIETTRFSFGTLAQRTHIVLDGRWISKIRVKIFVPNRRLVLRASLFRRESGTPWPSLSLAARAVFPVLAAQASARGTKRGLPTLDEAAGLSGLADEDAAQEAVAELQKARLIGNRSGVAWVAASWPADRVLRF